MNIDPTSRRTPATPLMSKRPLSPEQEKIHRQGIDHLTLQDEEVKSKCLFCVCVSTILCICAPCIIHDCLSDG